MTEHAEDGRLIESIETKTIAVSPRGEWNHGNPRAATVLDARRDWAPCLDTWGHYLKSGFLFSMSVSNQSARLGWIDDVVFWQHVWAGVEHESRTRPYSSCFHALRYALSEAAMLNNNVPFDTMLNKDTQRMVVEHLATQSLLLPAVMFNLLQSFYPDTEFFDHNQRQHWYNLQWKIDRSSRLYHSRWEPRTMDEVVDLLAYSLRAYARDKTTQLNILGHAIVNAPKPWQSKALHSVTFVEALRARLEPLLAEGVDLDTLMLCSGMSLNTDAVSKGIKSLGRHFCAGNADVKTKNPRAPELSVVLGLYELKNNHDLYDVACVLMQRSSAELISVADMFDSGLLQP